MTLRSLFAAAALAAAASVSAIAQEGFKTPVRNAGDDGVAAYRIPGLVTTPKGTLIAVYDVRYANSYDLQADIDVGMSRSTDGGRTWEPMRLVLDMGEWGGRPQAENGVGDPSVLADPNTGRIYVLGTWTHGIPGQRAWTSVGQGMEPGETAQLMMTVSDDDGLSWSAPRNLTAQIKQPEWYFTFQGPGRGIVMADGTLVFPMQFINTEKIPSSTIMLSRDGGETWEMGTPARSNTTESQVAEIEPGVLMLSMRDNRGTGRAVALTRDGGKTWTEHPRSGWLPDPVCMASLLQVPAAENCFSVDLLLFSNPADWRDRKNMTIRASLDKGMTWLPQNELCIDDGYSWGYSCLTMVDRETVGILYESSTCHILFEAVPLRDIVRAPEAGLCVEELPDFPIAVSAQICFPLGEGWFVLAGGSEYEDGIKTIDADIWICHADGRYAWSDVISEPLAYSAFVPQEGRVLVAGGNNGYGPTDRVWSLSDGEIQELGHLPLPVEQGVAVRDYSTMYLLGGLTTDGAASRGVYASEDGKAWRQIAVLPEPLVQPVALLNGNRLYVWGGYNPVLKTCPTEGWYLDLSRGRWHPAPGIPDGGTFVGATGVVDGEGRLVVFGGVDRDIFQNAIQGKYGADYTSWPAGTYHFRQDIWRFDPATQRWEFLGASGHAARAGAAGWITIEGDLIITGGELKPTVRTASVVRIALPK